MMEVLRIFRAAFMPVANLFLLAGVGAVLSSKRVSAFPPLARQHVSKLVFVAFGPCLIFRKLGVAFSMNALMEWWPIPLVVLINMVLGGLVGFLLGHVLQLPNKFRPIVLVLTAVGNYGNLPLVIISSVCGDATSPFKTEDCEERGIALVACGLWVGTLGVWVFADIALKRISSESNDNQLGVGDMEMANRSTVSTGYAEMEEGDEAGSDGETQSDADADVGAARVECTISASNNTTSNPASVSTIRTYLSLLISPPFIAVFAAMFVGMIPPLQWNLFDSAAPFHIIGDTVNTIGNAMIPCMLLVLGGNLAGANETSTEALSPRVVACILFTRLFVLPIIGTFLVLATRSIVLAESVATDPLFALVMLLTQATPSAVNLGTVATLHGRNAKEISAVLFWMYLATLPALTFWMAVWTWYLT